MTECPVTVTRDWVPVTVTGPVTDWSRPVTGHIVARDWPPVTVTRPVTDWSKIVTQ